jgi:hypothetical protein
MRLSAVFATSQRHGMIRFSQIRELTNWPPLASGPCQCLCDLPLAALHEEVEFFLFWQLLKGLDIDQTNANRSPKGTLSSPFLINGLGSSSDGFLHVFLCHLKTWLLYL